jgi:hypothetical protein
MSTSQLVVPQRAPLRRLSSMDASSKDLLHSMGPTVVVPPKHLMASSDGHEVAESMELARHELDSFRSATSSPSAPSTPPLETLVTDKFAFAFDIDGVLIRGGKVIPEAIDAMKQLNGENKYGIKV